MDSAGSISAYSVLTTECPVDSVVVYKDRAEVTRSVVITPDLLTVGEQTVKLTCLTLSADPESVRVKTSASCQILEVGHEICANQQDPNSSPLQEIKEQLIEVEKEKKLNQQNGERIKKQKALVEKYASSLVDGKVKEDITLTAAKDILAFHMSEAERLDGQDFNLNEERKKLDEKIALLHEEMRKITGQNILSIQRSRTITIVMDVKDKTEAVTLLCTYVVSDATWVPSYDIRVNTVENVLDLFYFAEVTQRSGEDWTDCRVSLSTSNPAIGSSPPPLPSKTVQFYSYRPVVGMAKGKMKSSYKRSSTRDYSDDDNECERRASFSLLEEQEGGLNMAMAAMAPGGVGGVAPKPRTVSVQGSGDAGSTTFIIQRKVTIEADNKPHKVTVMQEQFTPQTVCYVAPSVSAFVYLQAKTQNTSPYPLLASTKVSVFLDGNFISTSKITQANCGEFFNVFLGVDPSIKVEYLPCKMDKSVKGWMGGTEVEKYQYSTVIHNTKQQPCRIIVAEILPRSSTDKITIDLIEPALSTLAKPSGNAAPVTSEQDFIANMNSFGEGLSDAEGAWPKDFVTQNQYTNNIVWLKTVPAQQKVELKFSYKITFPQGQNVELR